MTRSPRSFAFLFVLAAASLGTAAAVGCYSNDSNGAANEADDAAGSSDASPSNDSAPNSDSGSDLPPPGCIEFTPTNVTSYRTASPPNAERYATAPDLSGDVSVGDPSLSDAFVFRLDGQTAVGDTPIGTTDITPYTYSNTGQLGVDDTPTDAGKSYAHVLYATSGTIRVTDMITPWQAKGTLENVRFDEGAVDNGAFVPKSGGACYWIRSVAFDTREAKGCKPFQASDPCGSGMQCMPTNAIGGDGICVRAGAAALGDACNWDDADAGAHVLWDSNCGAGLRCAQIEELSETSPTCRRICDVTAASSGCPAGTHCGGGYDICIPDAVFTRSGSGDAIDPAEIGSACSVDVATATSTDVYCGGGPNRTGWCFPYDGYADGGYSQPTCLPFGPSVAACVGKGDIVSYVAYKGGLDDSDLECIHWPHD